jgi:hypothetical protein
MTQHLWGDKDFDFNGLNEAIYYMSKNFTRWGRWTCFAKEKYGTARFEYLYCTNDSLFNLIYPQTLWFGHRPKMHKILSTIEKVWAPFIKYTGIKKLIRGYRVLVFNLVTLRAVKKWPQFKDELLWEPEFDELLYKWVKNKVGYKCNWVLMSNDTEEL